MKDYILVFGGCGWDCTHKQKDDLSYSDIPDVEMPGAKGANQAVASARAGYDVKMLSIVGDDEYGFKIIKNLQDNKIDTSCVKMLKNVKSDSCHIYVSKDGANDIRRTREAIDLFSTKMIYENAEIIKNASFVVTQSKMPRKVYIELIKFCSQNGVKTVLTPCPSKDLKITENDNLNLLQKVTFITANEQEALEISQANSIENAIKKLPNMIVTAGEKGVYFMDENSIVNMPAMKPKQIVDTTGAGDTFCGNFIVKILQGYSKKDAVKAGIKASTLKLEKMGAQPGMPYADEVENFNEMQ